MWLLTRPSLLKEVVGFGDWRAIHMKEAFGVDSGYNVPDSYYYRAYVFTTLDSSRPLEASVRRF